VLLVLLLQTALFPDITISKPSNVTIPIGSPGNYTVTVNNTGGAPAPNVTLVEVLPPGVEYVSGPPECTAKGQTITCNIGTIPPGGSKDVPIVVRPTDPGPFTITGNVTADNEQNTGNNGPVNTTITVVRTCAVYSGDGSSFPCGANTVPNANNIQSTSPSNAICCVSGHFQMSQPAIFLFACVCMQPSTTLAWHAVCNCVQILKFEHLIHILVCCHHFCCRRRCSLTSPSASHPT
jgi:uncharacterized repeat protein (TIGR01451 family)